MGIDRKVSVFRKVISVILSLAIMTMTISCTSKIADINELNINRISSDSRDEDGSCKIHKSLNACLKDGSYVFYKFEMKVSQDTIVSRGLKFTAGLTDSMYVSKVPLSDIDRFEFVPDAVDEGKIAEQVFFGILLMAMTLSIIIAHTPKIILS